MGNKSILYIGQDENFYEGLKKAIDALYDRGSVQFHFFNDQKEKVSTPSLIPKIISFHPQIIYIDFSLGLESTHLLARHLRLSLPSEKVTLVGILDRPSDDDSKKSANQIVSKEKNDYILAALTQMPIIHYKGDDYDKIIYHSFYLRFGDKVGRGEYACFKQRKFDEVFYYFSSLTHILDNALIVETSVEWKTDEIIKLSSDFIPELNEKYFKVESKSTEQLNTKFFYRYKVLTKFEDREDLPRVDLGLLRNYLGSLDKSGSNKKLKLLMIQNDLKVLSSIETPLSKLPYLVRYQSRSRIQFSMIHNFRPNIIAIELENKIEDMSAEGTILPNTIETLVLMISDIVKIKDYDPVINVFNCTLPLAELKEKVKYEKIICGKSEMSLSLLLRMLQIFDEKKKDFSLYQNDDLISDRDNPVSIYGLHRRSRLKIEVPVTITSISEQEVTFLTSNVLPERGVLYRRDGVPFYLTIASPPETLENHRGKNHYFAFINGITPTHAQSLRRHVNDLFFLEHEEKKKQELLEFKTKNRDAESKRALENKKKNEEEE